MEEYSIKRKIGDGAQGVVYEVEHLTTKASYAMKVICCTDQGQVNMALKEIKVLLQLRHPGIVSYVDFFLVFNSAELRHEFAEKSEGASSSKTVGGGEQREAAICPQQDSLDLCNLSNSESDIGNAVHGAATQVTTKTPSTTVRGTEQGSAAGAVPTALLGKHRQQVGLHLLNEDEIAVCLVMELCRNGDMQGLVREARQEFMKTGSHTITEAQALSWLEQAAAALQFIHDKGFLHRDLKPTNIFFDEYKDIKIGDFGLAATVGLGRNSVVGTPYYLAPERMLQQCYDGKVDIWGLGVVLLELLTLREQPINSMLLENPKVADAFIPQITKMGFSTKLATLLRDMLQREPRSRPSPLSILHRLASMTTSPPHLGMSATLFAGMSCPKLAEPLCDVCEVEVASLMCSSCQAAFCTGCDCARHKHHSRQSHDRTTLSSFLNSINGTSPTPLSATQLQQQQPTLSFSRGLSSGNTSDQTRTSVRKASFFPSTNNISPRTQLRDRDMNSRTFTRFQLALPGSSASISEFSMTQRLQASRDGLGNNGRVAETLLRVPDDVPSLVEALLAVENMPHIREILVAGNTTHTVPLVLTSRLPDSIKLVGESPPPMLEVVDSPFALHCKSGKGTVENFILRHVGRCRPKLRDAEANATTSVSTKRLSRPTAVSMTGGEWRLHKCRISCVEGSGVTVGGGKKTPSPANGAQTPRRLHSPSLAVRSPPASSAEEDSGDDEPTSREPRITQCTFIDVTAAGVVLLEKSKGLYEGNTFSSCGFAAFLVKKDATPCVRANRITDGTEAGIFCQDASGVIEYNVIAQNAGCGIVVKGASAVPVIRKNRILTNVQAGVFCCDRAMPFVCDNEICHNGKAGVLVKTRAAPKITHNVIEGGKEAGIYVLEKGAGIIEKNRIRGNCNAGLLVTTGGHPHVIHNTLTKNAYEGVWVCKNGGGTFCDNDLRGNVKGAKDIEEGSHVTWVGNVEQ
ncbi:hypothetical protein JKF63_02997 [Porcisia hertigi]|uniref:non-specific serine/threonine protein kinase n=1 Tax=Porcisia hertigi TaxID=2761500 RepID=A0A836L560_9TRYP|nr:hypothetical protein JKF63_02997 [Porcisia hertigi]